MNHKAKIYMIYDRDGDAIENAIWFCNNKDEKNHLYLEIIYETEFEGILSTSIQPFREAMIKFVKDKNDLD